MVTWASVETDLKMLPAGLASLSLEGCPIPETTLASLLKEPASLSHLAIARSPWTGRRGSSSVMNKPFYLALLSLAKPNQPDPP